MSNPVADLDPVACFAALSHPARLSVVRLLVEAGQDGLSAGEIAARLGLPPSSLTHHTHALVQAGLLQQRRDSRRLIYSARIDMIRMLAGYLTRNCCGGRPC